MHSISQRTLLFLVFSHRTSAAGRGTISATGVVGWGDDMAWRDRLGVSRGTKKDEEGARRRRPRHSYK